MQTDPSEFRLKHEPGHPAADANGNVKYPNVNSLVEMTDMRDAQRSYEANLNIISATRRMVQRTLDILESENARDVGGVIHCFSEDRPFAERALDLGFDLSFSGIVTFKSAKSIHDVAAWAPLDRIMIETDSPYLAPVPMRGKMNEHHAEKLEVLSLYWHFVDAVWIIVFAVVYVLGR